MEHESVCRLNWLPFKGWDWRSQDSFERIPETSIVAVTLISNGFCTSTFCMNSIAGLIKFRSPDIAIRRNQNRFYVEWESRQLNCVAVPFETSIWIQLQSRFVVEFNQYVLLVFHNKCDQNKIEMFPRSWRKVRYICLGYALKIFNPEIQLQKQHSMASEIPAWMES